MARRETVYIRTVHNSYDTVDYSSSSWHHNSSRVFAATDTFFHSSRLCTLSSRFRIPKFSKSCFIPSIRRFFGRPLGLFPVGFQPWTIYIYIYGSVTTFAVNRLKFFVIEYRDNERNVFVKDYEKINARLVGIHHLHCFR